MREVIMRLTTKPFEAAAYAEIVQELVRCKDCEHWYPEEDDNYGHCRRYDFWTSGDWYCADGKRREDETDLDVCVSGGCDIIND